jgi:hypothetical protein
MTDWSNFPGFGYDPFKNDSLIGDIDPFVGTAQQTARMRAFCKIDVNGVDVTDKLKPHLISVHVSAGQPASAAEIELDDRDGILPLPPLMAPVLVGLGWQSEAMVTVFNGIIMDVEHGFGRKQGGRRLWVHAKGWNELSSTLKEPIQDQMGQGAPPGKQEGELKGLPEWLRQLTGNANVQASISGALSKFKSDMWHVANSSVMQEIEKLSQDHGFVYQFVDGGKVLIESPGQGGLSCHAIWRQNLIGWRVRPFAARPSFGGSKQQWYDATVAGWKSATQKFGLQDPWAQAGSSVQSQTPAATESGANASNEGAQSGAEASAFGNGRIMINGEPKARWNGHVMLIGARPGVDGLYLIKVVEHVYSRQGFITTLEVMPVAQAPDTANVNRGWLPKPAPNIG